MEARCVMLLAATLAVLAGITTAKTLMLCGGYISDGNSQIWNKAVTLSGGRGKARIGILTTANERAITEGRRYKALFESYGVAEAYWIPIYEGNSNAPMDPVVIKNIKRMTGFFFGGGAQQRIIQNLLMQDRKPTPAFAAIQEMYEKGTPVVGTSAGAMVMPSVHTMVGGTSYGALLSGALTVDEIAGARDLVYDPEGGLGFFNGHTVDSHFHERGRQGRLLRLLSDTRKMPKGTDYGIGIDEETALLLTGVSTDLEKGEVIGDAGVFYIDVSKSYLDTGSQYWRILNVFCHYATAGDMINTNIHTITPSPSKSPIKGNETANNAESSSDIFQETIKGTVSEFRKVADSLFNSRFDSLTYGTTLEDRPPYFVILSEDSRSSGFIESEGSSPKISYMNLKMEMRPLVENGDY